VSRPSVVRLLARVRHAAGRALIACLASLAATRIVLTPGAGRELDAAMVELGVPVEGGNVLFG